VYFQKQRSVPEELIRQSGNIVSLQSQSKQFLLHLEEVLAEIADVTPYSNVGQLFRHPEQLGGHIIAAVEDLNRLKIGHVPKFLGSKS